MLELIVDANAREISFAKAQCRPRNAAIDCEPVYRFSSGAHGLLSNVEIVFDHTLTRRGFGRLAGIAGKRGGWREQGCAAGKEKCFHEDSESLVVHGGNSAWQPPDPLGAVLHRHGTSV